MFKLIALAMHFSPYFQGPVDPIVMEMIKKAVVDLASSIQNQNFIIEICNLKARPLISVCVFFLLSLYLTFGTHLNKYATLVFASMSLL